MPEPSQPRKRRCPLHPDGCTKHPNPTPPARVPGNPAKRTANRQPLRGSIARYVAVYRTTGTGNPARRRTIARRKEQPA